MYEKLQIWRRIGLGASPLPTPYGVFTQTIRGGGQFRLPSESELRLNLFAAWTLGYTYSCAFLYSTSGDRALVSALFDGYGDTKPTDSFWQLSRANAEGQKLGPALTRLLSVDVRFIPGLHRDGVAKVATNNKPGHTGYGNMSTIAGWEDNHTPARPAAAAGLLNVTATSRSAFNHGLRGDVVVGFFRALLPAVPSPAPAASEFVSRRPSLPKHSASR